MRGRQCTAAPLLGLILTVPGLACTSTQKVAPSPRWTDPEEACFNIRKVGSFSPLHGRFVYVRTLGDESFLLTLDHNYTSLPFATGVTIAGSFSRVCSDTGAMLTFMDFGRQVFCRIVRVEAVADKEQAEKLVKRRTAGGPET